MRIIHQAEMDCGNIRGTKRYIENGTNQYQKGGTHTKIGKVLGEGRRNREGMSVCPYFSLDSTQVGMQQRREKEQVLFHHVKTDVVLDQISLIWSISETGEEIKDMVVLTLAH